MAELADEWAARGLPVVTVNPSAPIGERDVKPTATGQMIVDFLRGKMKAYVDTGLNLVDVRDVAAQQQVALAPQPVRQPDVEQSDQGAFHGRVGEISGSRARMKRRLIPSTRFSTSS